MQLLRGKIPFARMADAKLKAQLRTAADQVRKAVADQPVRDAADSAWRALHEPIELGRAPDLWLRALPDRLAGSGFVSEDGQLVYRIRIDARVALHSGAKPPALFEKPLPEPQRPSVRGDHWQRRNAHSGKTLLRLPIEMPVGDLIAAVAAAFPQDDMIETRADTKSAPRQSQAVESRPAARARKSPALALQLDVVEPARLVRHDRQSLSCRKAGPRCGNGVLEFKDIAFPPAALARASSGAGIADRRRTVRRPLRASPRGLNIGSTSVQRCCRASTRVSTSRSAAT